MKIQVVERISRSEIELMILMVFAVQSISVVLIVLILWIFWVLLIACKILLNAMILIEMMLNVAVLAMNNPSICDQIRFQSDN
jgi:hypothetical protein